MTLNCQFKEDEILFHQGDPSDSVFLVHSGEIEILREVNGDSVLLGHVRAGEWLGEMGVIENRTRSATARAATDCAAEVLTAHQFLDRVSTDSNLAQDLILRLSIRLRAIEDKVAGDLLPLTHQHHWHASERTATPDTAEITSISIAACTDALSAQMGAAPIHIEHLPFVIGRMLIAGEGPPPRYPDLVLIDQEPFRLSRDHFMIMRGGGRLLVSDLGSTLGTIVNGRGIGHHFMRDAAPLDTGENRIIAGGRDSPFKFVISVGQTG
jgi:CRP/FNR family transcriptional regulator, cyclic AMP receptor protein